MKTKNLFFIGSLIFLAGISKGNAQNNYSAPGTNNAGNDNSFVGANSGLNNTSNSNSGFGSGTLQNNTGGFNSAFGAGSMVTNLSGTLNCAFGTRSMESNNSGSGNVAFGHRALGANSTGNDNVALGYAALLSNNNSGNIAVGSFTPRNFAGGGDNNIFIGNQTAVNLNSGSFNTIIGKVSFDPGASTTLLAGNNTSSTIILADGNSQQRLFIHSNGNTGIGLGNNVIPQNRLEVRSATANTSGLRFNRLNSTFVPTTTASKFLTVDGSGDVILQNLPTTSGIPQTLSIAGNVLSISNGNSVTLPSSNPCNIYTCDGTLTGNRTVNMNNNSMIFDSQANGRIYIGDTNATNPFTVGAGNNFPLVVMPNSNFRLLVEGGILTERVKVALRTTANWADYVFANDYKLMPLKEVETYINENQHLPGIQSASDLQKEGLDIADMQAKQMGKIEELTLYVIEQNKALEKQSQEIEELKAQVTALLGKK